MENQRSYATNHKWMLLKSLIDNFIAAYGNDIVSTEIAYQLK